MLYRSVSFRTGLHATFLPGLRTFFFPFLSIALIWLYFETYAPPSFDITDHLTLSFPLAFPLPVFDRAGFLSPYPSHPPNSCVNGALINFGKVPCRMDTLSLLLPMSPSISPGSMICLAKYHTYMLQLRSLSSVKLVFPLSSGLRLWPSEIAASNCTVSFFFH